MPDSQLPTFTEVAKVWPLGAVLLVILTLAVVGYWKIYRPECERRDEARRADREAQAAESTTRESIAVAHKETALQLATVSFNLREAAAHNERHGQLLQAEIDRARDRCDARKDPPT